MPRAKVVAIDPGVKREVEGSERVTLDTKTDYLLNSAIMNEYNASGMSIPDFAAMLRLRPEFTKIKDTHVSTRVRGLGLETNKPKTAAQAEALKVYELEQRIAALEDTQNRLIVWVNQTFPTHGKVAFKP